MNKRTPELAGPCRARSIEAGVGDSGEGPLHRRFLRLLELLARQVLEKQPGAKIVFDVKVSQALEEDIAAHGGVPIMWKTGHSHIKAKLHEEKAALAGEMSGHIFFVENYYGFDDGVYSGLRFVEYVSRVDKPLSEIIIEEREDLG